MTTLTAHEVAELDVAASSGRPVVMFIHGLWLLSNSWRRWRERFEACGYATVAPGWPDDPETVEAARANPDVFANKMVGQVMEHYLEALRSLPSKPAVVGHSFGGLIAQQVAGEGASAVTVAIDPAPFRGVLSVPFSSLKSSAPVVANPVNAGRAVTLTLDEFGYGWANALDADEAKELYEQYHVAAAGRPIFQAVAANINPFTEMRVDIENPARGPLLLIAGAKDHTVPTSVVTASYKRQQHNPGVTEFLELPNRGHALTIDHGWREVADTALTFMQPHLPPPV
jgi:pimeloyl-ACP methyl ester carboxylesterase